MYFRFLFLMSAGMFGVALVLTTLMDTLLSNWSLESDLRRYVDGMTRKARFIQVHDYDEEAAVVRTRLQAVKAPLPKEVRLAEAAVGPRTPPPALLTPTLPLPRVRSPQASTAPRISWLTPLPPPTPVGPEA